MRRALPLLLLGIGILVTEPWFVIVDDEIAIIEMAEKPAGQTIQLFLRGAGQHEHPPLYDLILHFWLRLTHSRLRLLRIPSICFYLAGWWVLAAAAERLSGTASSSAVLWLGALWPYGFHFGRLAAWYSFSFLLVALLTERYLRLVEKPALGPWLGFFFTSLALLYTNYFGWVLLACLTVDFLVRHTWDAAKPLRWLLGTWALWLAAYLPLWHALWTRSRTVGLGRSVLSTVLNGLFNAYALFVSESVAPWFWRFSIPAGLAIAACMLLVLFHSAAPARRFLLYFLFAFGVMAVADILTTKRLLFISAWLLLPLGATLGTMPRQFPRRILAVSLALIAGIGWYGIFSRQMYAAPRFLEPWPEVAQRAAEHVREGETVVGNNTSFFFYLSYALLADSRGRIENFLPRVEQSPRVFDPQQWAEAGRPAGSELLLVNGAHFGVPAAPTQDAERWLSDHCRLEQIQRLVRDSGYEIKQRYFSSLVQPLWRIEISEYSCVAQAPLTGGQGGVVPPVR